MSEAGSEVEVELASFAGEFESVGCSVSAVSPDKSVLVASLPEFEQALGSPAVVLLESAGGVDDGIEAEVSASALELGDSEAP